MPLEGEESPHYINIIVGSTFSNVDPIDSLQTLFDQHQNVLNTIEKIEDSQELQVFPNPANSFVSIKYKNESLVGKHIFFYNNQGMLLKESEINTDSVNIENLPAGITFYRVYDKDHGRMLFGKFIIQR